MWTTADGHVLSVPGFRLRKWAEAKKRAGSTGCACEGCLGRVVSELEAELGEIAGRARRVGTATGRRSGRRMPIFSATRGARRYRIFTRPLFGRQHTIVAVTPQPVESAPAIAPEEPPAEDPPAEDPPAEEPPSDGEEREVSRGPVDARIEWSEPLRLDEAQRRSNWPAVYLIEVNGDPIYVGQTFDVPTRMKDHQDDHAAGRRAAGRWPKGDIRVRLGRIFPKPRNVLEILEHAVVRTLQPDPTRARVLKNQTPLLAFQAAGKINIRNILPADKKYSRFVAASAARRGLGQPAAQNRDLNLGKGDRYELFHDLGPIV